MRVHNEYDRLRRLNEEDIQKITNIHKGSGQDTNSALTLSLLNICSLRKHSSDIKCDKNLFNSDILAFTETQLLPGDNDFDIVQNLTPFTLYRNDHNSDKFCSLATCVKNDFHVLNQEYFPTLNAVKFLVTCDTNNVRQQTLSFLLLYRKNGTSILDFVSGIDYLLRAHSIDVILGDLNVNFFSIIDMQPLTDLMESFNYVQIVDKPTFISGSLLKIMFMSGRQLTPISGSSSV